MNNNVLIFTRSMGLGGTENVILQLTEILMESGFNIVVCSSGGVNVAKLNKLGIKHYYMKDITKIGVLNFFINLILLYKIILKENISIIHVHHRMAAFYTQFLYQKRKLLKIASVHNTFYDKKILTRIAYKNFKLIAVGNEVKKNLVDFFGLKESDIVVIRNAVKPFNEIVVMDKHIKNCREKGLKVVINVGRLTKQKGMEYFILAADKVIRKNKNVAFLIVGTGELEHKLIDLVLEKKLSEKVFFLGYRSDVRNLMSQSDLIVLSSLWEGFPLTPIESFSVGKTVVATSVDGTKEIVDNYVNGILVKPKDYDELATQIVEVLAKDDLRAKLESNAYAKYLNNYSIERLRSDYKKLYENLLNNK
ncbi:glycosyltransferase family 4 protein [Enterococcus cecorum]|uniref:glycosyltransferase family 4 protein n=1 Tax=Enterococcus cecorum TaxID=44008 RepID=UPI0032C4234D